MTAASPLVFPGSRTVAGWWRQLASYQPSSLWIAHLHGHRVEALIRAGRAHPLDQLWLLVLGALARLMPGSLAQLNERLCLGRPFLFQTLRELEQHFLVTAGPQECWSLTDAGRHALASGDYPSPVYERRVFHYIEDHQSHSAFHFVPLSSDRPGAPSNSDHRPFDIASLRDSIRQPIEWKERHHFPRDVQDVIEIAAVHENGDAETSLYRSTGGRARSNELSDWKKVVVDAPFRLALTLVRAAPEPGAECLHGFAFRPDGWLLDSSKPLFTLSAGWQETFPGLAADLPVERWSQAWRTWCQPRGLVPFETEPCRFEKQGHLLRLIITPRYAARLRTHGQSFRNDVWLFAGESGIREAALLEIVEVEPRPSFM